MIKNSEKKLEKSIGEPPVWMEYCKSCKRYHRVTLKSCPDCGVHQTPQPKSEEVYDKCNASYICDGCEAYLDHYSI